MFIRVIEGRTKDPDAVHRQIETWERELMPDAIGYLGSTGGCTSTGDCIFVARFESREAAQRNSDRPEQTRWWEATEKLFDGPVRFHESEDVQVMTHGDLDAAHFVQVMEGHVSDRDRAVNLEQESDPLLAEARPDLLGSVTIYFDDRDFTEVAYFTSEDAAREGERKELPADADAMVKTWQDVMNVERWLDIQEPWLTTA